MKKKVIISLSLLLSPLVMALGLRTFDNYQLSLKQNAAPKHPETTIIELYKKGEWTVSKRELFEYDEAFQVISMSHQVRKEGSWINQNRMSYTYDKQNSLEVQRIWSNWTNGSWQPKFRFTSERDEHNRPTLESTEEYKADDWEVVRKNETTYDPISGKKKETTYFNLVDGKWSRSWKDHYQFAGDNLEQKSGYRWTENGWVTNLITDYAYNRNGERVREVINRVINSTEYEWRKTNFFLDTNGTKTSGQVYVWKDSVWMDSERHTYQYDKF